MEPSPTRPHRRVKPPGRFWRMEAAHPFLVNLAIGVSGWGMTLLYRPWWWGLPWLVGCPIMRAFGWRRGGYLRRPYEARVAAAEASAS